MKQKTATATKPDLIWLNNSNNQSKTLLTFRMTAHGDGTRGSALLPCSLSVVGWPSFYWSHPSRKDYIRSKHSPHKHRIDDWTKVPVVSPLFYCCVRLQLIINVMLQDAYGLFKWPHQPNLRTCRVPFHGTSIKAICFSSALIHSD